MSDVPVIVLNWNRWDETIECLRSLREAEDVTSVWLVDNGSAVDRSGEALAVWPRLRVVRLNRNYGFAGGMNRAMRLAAEEGHAFVYLLNNDTIVVPGFLRAAIAAATDDVALVGSRILRHGFNHGAVLFDGVYHGPDARPVDRYTGSRRVPYVNGAGMLVRLAAVQRNGYFDERFFCYHEEVELCMRLSLAGWSVVIADGSRIFHKRRRSDENSNGLYYRVRNRFLIAERHDGWRRTKRKFEALRHAAIAGRQALHDRDFVRCLAVGAALYDARACRFGERGLCQSPTAATLMLLACTLIPNIRRPQDGNGSRMSRRPANATARPAD